MRHPKVLIASIAALMTLVVPAAATPSPAPPQLPVHYGLGDSWAAGEGADHPKTQGYMALAYREFRDELDCSPAASSNASVGCHQLRLVNLGRSATDELPGVRTGALIAEQLPPATADIAARNADDDDRNDVEVIVLTVGGNDAFDALRACQTTPATCGASIGAMLTTVSTNLNVILGGLRAAAGPDTPIVITTYDNPAPFCVLGASPFAVQLSQMVLSSLNDVIAAAAATQGVEVADVEGHLDQAAYWVGGDDCLHLTSAGYGVVAGLVTEAVTG